VSRPEPELAPESAAMWSGGLTRLGAPDWVLSGRGTVSEQRRDQGALDQPHFPNPTLVQTTINRASG
jgi:hypothetical protein